MISRRKKKYTLLLVEDHPDIVEMYTTVFESLPNAKVETAGDMQSGLKKARELRPHLILLDLLIPKVEGTGFNPTSRHGFDFLKEIREDKRLAKTKVMVLTNLESTDDRNKAKKLGVVDYIVKSQTLPNEVLKKVRKIFS